MGNYFSTNSIVKFNERFYEEYPCFLIVINIHSINYLDNNDIHNILQFLSNTQNVLAYGHKQSFYLLYNSEIKEPSLRSNSFSDIISYMSSELTIFLMKHLDEKKELRFLDVRIESGSIIALITKIKNIIKNNKYLGEVYGIENLNEDKINQL